MQKLNNKGSILIFVTLGFAILGVFMGFAVDFGKAYLTRARVSRLVDAAALAAAKVVKGQAAFEAEATRAACDSMLMNGAEVQMTAAGACESTNGKKFSVTVDFVDVPVAGGPPIKFAQVTGVEPVTTTFLGLLSFMSPGDYSTLNVTVTAQAGPERPVDLMLVLDRSGSMGQTDGSGRTKLNALKCALTGLNCSGDGFLGQNFSPNDQVGMTSFGKRGCGTVGGAEFTGDKCTPNRPLGSSLSDVINSINSLPLSGTTNTMEGLRTAGDEIAKVVNDPARATTRKVVLLVTDGQPTALRLDSIAACEADPITGASLGGPTWTGAAGCYFVKRGNSTSVAVSDGLTRFRLNTQCEESFMFPLKSNQCGGETVAGTGIPNSLYLNQMAAVRNAARDEAQKIRTLGSGETVIFVIAIGEPTNPDATARLDANARCLLAQIANDKDLLANPSTNPATGSCAAVYAVNDGDDHSDLTRTTPAGTSPTFKPNHQRGKVFTVDLNGDVQTQLQLIFNEIAALLKLRLTI